MIILTVLLKVKMKKLILNKETLVLVCLVFVLAGCNDAKRAEMNRSVEIFLMGFFQVLNLAIFGIGALTLSVLSGSSVKQVFKIVGSILLGVFVIFTSMTYFQVQRLNPVHFDVYYIFLISLAMIGISLFFLIKKPVINEPELKSKAAPPVKEDEEII